MLNSLNPRTNFQLPMLTYPFACEVYLNILERSNHHEYFIWQLSWRCHSLLICFYIFPLAIWRQHYMKRYSCLLWLSSHTHTHIHVHTHIHIPKCADNGSSRFRLSPYFAWTYEADIFISLWFGTSVMMIFRKLNCYIGCRYMTFIYVYNRYISEI